MPITFTRLGYLEVWLGAEFISRHVNETDAVESLLAHAEANPSEVDREYQLRFPDKRVKVPGIRRPRTDSTPPSIPGSLTVGEVTATTVALSWFPSSDATVVAGYQIWRNGQPLATSALPFYTDTGLTASTTYTYNVSAFDDSGNISGLSNQVSTTTLSDTPNVAPVWQTIEQQELTTGTAYLLNLAPLVADPEGQPLTITQVMGTLPTGITYNPTTKTISGTPTAASTPTVTFRASDGVTTADADIDMNCLLADSTPPTVPTNLAGVGVSRQRIDLTWTASSEVVVADSRTGTLVGYKLYRGGSLLATLGLVTSYSDTGLAQSTGYSYRLSAYDSNGNESAQCTAVAVTTLANTPPELLSSTTLPDVNHPVSSPQTYQLDIFDADGDTVVATRTGGTAPAGVTVSTTGLVTFPAGHATGTYTIEGLLDDGYGDVPAADWEARSTGPGVVWRHRMANESELLASYIAPTNADQGEAIVIGTHPPIVCPHVGTELNGTTYFEETLIGARLAQNMDAATLTVHSYPTGAMNNITDESGAIYAELQIPATSAGGVASSTLGFVAVQSVYRVTSIADPTKFWYFDADVNTTARPRGPILNADGSYTLPVRAGRSQQYLMPLVNTTGITVEHCVLSNLSNPYQTIVIDENIPVAGRPVPGGPNTSWWPNPTNPPWNPATGVIPADAYTVVVQYEYTTDRIYLWKDRLTVYAASYDPDTQLTTLVVRRAAIQASNAAGRIEADWVSRAFPCAFPPPGAQSGATFADVLIGRDNKGGWRRSFAALPGTDNGVVDENGDPVDDPACGGTIPLRKLINPNTGNKYTNYRTGYYGHRHYHGIWTDTNPYHSTGTPAGVNSLITNGRSPYNGDELYLSFNVKYSDTWAYTDTSSKTFFIDCFEREANSQIVGNAPTMSERRWKWYHNKGSDLNSHLRDENSSYQPGSEWEGTCVTGSLGTVGACWEPPLGEYCGILVHIKAGHDNDLTYAHDEGSTLTAVISNDGSSTMTIECTHMPLLDGMTWGMDGTKGYFATDTAEEGNPQVGVNVDGNPIGLDPTQTGYFDNWELQIGPAGSNAYGEFKITTHTRINATTSRYVLEKRRAQDTWPSASPTVGATIRIQWIDAATSARYKDTYIKLYKKQIGDTGWVPVVDLVHPIAYSKGNAPTQNPPGWSEFQPTAYANVDDNNLPPDMTRYIRMTDFILSHLPIPAPSQL